MSRRLPISNDYPPDWPEINARACEEAGLGDELLAHERLG